MSRLPKIAYSWGTAGSDLVAGVRSELLAIFEDVHLKDWFAADHIFPEEEKTFSSTLRAVRRANEFANRDARVRPRDPQAGGLPGEGTEPTYYFV